MTTELLVGGCCVCVCVCNVYWPKKRSEQKHTRTAFARGSLLSLSLSVGRSVGRDFIDSLSHLYTRALRLRHFAVNTEAVGGGGGWEEVVLSRIKSCREGHLTTAAQSFDDVGKHSRTREEDTSDWSCRLLFSLLSCNSTLHSTRLLFGRSGQAWTMCNAFLCACLSDYIAASFCLNSIQYFPSFSRFLHLLLLLNFQRQSPTHLSGLSLLIRRCQLQQIFRHQHYRDLENKTLEPCPY